MTILDSTNENRFFEGYLTVEMKDKQGEITMVDELYKVLPIWMDRGAPITDTHSNRVIGKGINFAKASVESEGVTYPAIKITGKIHKNYELDTDIWDKIRTGEYRGLSFGGATKADRTPKVMKDGDIAYALTDLEHYEVAVCKDPAVPLAIITDYNPLAKATVPSEPRGDGKEVIKCDKFGCYVNKGEDWSNAGGDSPNATSTQTIDTGGMGKTVKPIKVDTKVSEVKDGIKTEVTPLEGGLTKEGSSTATSGTGGGVRAHIGDAYNQDDPDKQTSQNTKRIVIINAAMKHNEDVNKVLGALAAGAARVGGAIVQGAGRAASAAGRGIAAGAEDAGSGSEDSSDESDGGLVSGVVEGATGATSDFVKDEIEENVQPLEPKEASAYQTEDGNNQLGGQAVPKEKKDDHFCPSCGTPKHRQGATEDDHIKVEEERLEKIEEEESWATDSRNPKNKAEKECSECGQPFDTEGEHYEKQVEAHKKHHKDSPDRASHNVSDADVTFVDNNEGKKVTWTTRSSDNIVNEFLDMLQTEAKKELKQRKGGNYISQEEQNLGKAKVKRGRRVYPNEGRHMADGDKPKQTSMDNPEWQGEVKTGLYGQKVKTWEVFLENKGAREKLRNLVTAPDVYPSEIKGIGESTSDEDEKLKAWEFFLEKKHEWDHLSKDPEEDEKIKEEIDDSGNN